MAKVKFELSRAGLAELMKSGEMQSILNDAADRIAAAASAAASPNIKGASESYVAVAAKPLTYVAIAEVKATDFAGRLDNSKHNTLEKAVGSVKV